MNLFRLLKCVMLAFTAISVFSPIFLPAQTQSPDQTTNRATLSPFISGLVGIGNIGGGSYIDRGKIGGDLLLGVTREYSAHRRHAAGLMLGGMEWRGGHDAICAIPASGTGCVPTAPETHYASLLVGAEMHTGIVTVAGMFGPGIFGVGSSIVGQSTDSNTTKVFGTVLRADVWFRVVTHLEVGGAASMRIIPAYRHERLSANSISTGFRVYR